MKPISASEVLKTRIQPQNNSEGLRNRKDSVAKNLEVVNTRERVNSFKRKASSELNEGTGKKPYQGGPPTVDCKKLDFMDKKIKMLRGICGKLNDDAAKLKIDIGLENVIRSFCEFVDVSASLHEDFMSLCKVELPDPDPPGNETVFDISSQDAEPVTVPAATPTNSYSNIAARKPILQGFVAPSAAPVRKGKQAPDKPKRDPKHQAFVDAVKHSERSTLVFNLNLGNRKTLNERTILTKATLALSEAAAEVEGNKGKPPSREAVSALDDVMSVIENVTLFGKVTKPYVNPRNPADPKNRTFFTLPVRYDFKDRNTRWEAETILRDTCKAECSTPYPTILRHCIRQVVNHVRKDFPRDFIKVTVDSENVALNVSRRGDDGWYTYNDPIPLPREVLDVHARYVPDNLVLRNLPERRIPATDQHDTDRHVMDEDQEEVTDPDPESGAGP
jgi:hypothetical protein